MLKICQLNSHSHFVILVMKVLLCVNSNLGYVTYYCYYVTVMLCCVVLCCVVLCCVVLCCVVLCCVVLCCVVLCWVKQSLFARFSYHVNFVSLA